jgi:peptidoglycan-associated lipoprotein
MLVPRRSTVALLLAVVAISACKSKPAPTPAPVTPTATPARPAFNRDSAAAAAERARAATTTAAAADEARRNAAALSAVKATVSKVVYFDYDKDEIRDDQKATLEAKVPILTANPALRIRVAGHTDERGSDEYNIALGQRRAASAKRYLAARGIAEGRIETISFGEERPVAGGHDESAWSQNRRDEFEIIGGGDSIKVPK